MRYWRHVILAASLLSVLFGTAHRLQHVRAASNCTSSYTATDASTGQSITYCQSHGGKTNWGNGNAPGAMLVNGQYSGQLEGLMVVGPTYYNAGGDPNQNEYDYIQADTNATTTSNTWGPDHGAWYQVGVNVYGTSGTVQVFAASSASTANTASISCPHGPMTPFSGTGQGVFTRCDAALSNVSITSGSQIWFDIKADPSGWVYMYANGQTIMAVSDTNAKYGLADQGYVTEAIAKLNGINSWVNNANGWSIFHELKAAYVTDINGGNGQYINPAAWMPFDAQNYEGNTGITPSNMGCAYSSGVYGTGGVMAGTDGGNTGWITGCKANPNLPG